MQQRRRRHERAPELERVSRGLELVLGVNLMGVAHGIRTFIPIMIEQDEEAPRCLSWFARVSVELCRTVTEFVDRHGLVEALEHCFSETASGSA